MFNEKTKQQLNECLASCGIYYETEDDDPDLSMYILDSLMFISLVITVEDSFGIEIPADLLISENFVSMNAFCYLVEELIKET